jgi:hypothetical protein
MRAHKTSETGQTYRRHHSYRQCQLKFVDMAQLQGFHQFIAFGPTGALNKDTTMVVGVLE